MVVHSTDKKFLRWLVAENDFTGRAARAILCWLGGKISFGQNEEALVHAIKHLNVLYVGLLYATVKWGDILKQGRQHRI